MDTGSEVRGQTAFHLTGHHYNKHRIRIIHVQDRYSMKVNVKLVYNSSTITLRGTGV